MRRILNNPTVITWSFLVPALSGLLIFKLYPITLAFWESLHLTSFMGGEEVREFVGIGNYLDLGEDFVFWRSLKATAILALIINPLQIFLALVLALLLQNRVKYIQLIRSLFFVPIGIALPIASVVWGIMLDPNQGLVNGFLGLLNIDPQPFLTSEDQAMWAIILIATWKGVAFWMLFLLAGLEDIPRQYYEAVKLDGANYWQRLLYITLPQLKRTLLFVLVADTVANFVLIVPMLILTQGGPSQSTNVLMYEAYRSGFIFQDFGRSMAIVSILTVITLTIIALQVFLLREKKERV